MNGLNPEIFFEWAALLNLGRDRAAKRHLMPYLDYSKLAEIIHYMRTTLLAIDMNI